MNQLSDAQADMRDGYLSGAPGVIASGVAWSIAGIVAWRLSPEKAVWALFIGGMFIHPVGVLLAKLLGRAGKHTRGNPLAGLAAANTVWMLLCLPLAFGVSRLRIDWFFPAMLCVIGGRYLTFAPLYGMRIYWLCGGALALAGCLLVAARSEPFVAAFVGAAIEFGFGVFILISSRRIPPLETPPPRDTAT